MFLGIFRLIITSIDQLVQYIKDISTQIQLVC